MGALWLLREGFRASRDTFVNDLLPEGASHCSVAWTWIQNEINWKQIFFSLHHKCQSQHSKERQEDQMPWNTTNVKMFLCFGRKERLTRIERRHPSWEKHVGDYPHRPEFYKDATNREKNWSKIFHIKIFIVINSLCTIQYSRNHYITIFCIFYDYNMFIFLFWF